ncbi:hypothetical protein F383_17197 [Gossypium arboreum]|uniref:Uncharacterized protein n=1 Tax=Gossypium arboreum TaxID=29729 RepID=A0A0B0NJJ8_GOSAR|nr:hypothetical protein F383_17197 [Gossypium arboreum]
MGVWSTRVTKSRPCRFLMLTHFLRFWPVSRSFYSPMLT